MNKPKSTGRCARTAGVLLLAAALLAGSPVTASAFPKITFEAFRQQFSKAKGRWQVYVIWGSWCRSCTDDFRDIDEMFKVRWKDQPVDIITVSLDGESTETQAESLYDKMGVKWKTFSVAEGAENEKIMHFLDPRWQGDIPYYVVFSDKGERTLVRSGRLSGKTLDYHLTRLTGRKGKAIKEEETRKLRNANPPK